MNGRLLFTAFLVLAGLCAPLAGLAAPSSSALAQTCDYFNPELLVDVDWLEKNMDHPGLRIIDFGRRSEDYALGHIPCAAFIDRASLSAEVEGVPDQLISVEELDGVLEQAGVSDGSTVVIYDDAGGLWASRLFWAMEYLGHRDVRMLNGGWDEWVLGDRDVCQVPASVPRGDFTPEIRADVLATKDWILSRLDDSGVAVLDVRSPEEYSGTDLRANRGGHIPGAINIEWALALDEAEEQVFIPSDDLRAIYEAAGISENAEVVTYCQGGVRAAHTYFALRLLGYPRVRVYDASWVEWGNDPDVPVATDAAGE
jgi:thiosulfate/3-mercaptopyruvate sulfurtransferase